MKPAHIPTPAALNQASQAATRAYRKATEKLHYRSAEIALKQAELEVDLVEDRIRELHAQIDNLESKS
jgi:hypothetical protein